MGTRVRMRVSGGLVLWLAVGLLLWGLEAARRGEGLGDLWAQVWPWGMVLAAAVIHELGHLGAAWGAGVSVRGLSLDLLGARMELGGMPSYGQEAFVAAGGPLMSLVSGALVYPWAAHPWATGPQGDGMTAAAVFCGASVLLGLLNLLPVGTLDGGRMLRCAVAGLWGDRVAVAVLRGTTAVCLGLLWMLSAYGLLRGGGFLSAFAFSLCLLGRTVCREG